MYCVKNKRISMTDPANSPSCFFLCSYTHYTGSYTVRCKIPYLVWTQGTLFRNACRLSEKIFHPSA